jgi:hypothetical protein
VIPNDLIRMSGLVSDRNNNGWYGFRCITWRSALDDANSTQMKPFLIGSVIKFKAGFKFFTDSTSEPLTQSSAKDTFYTFTLIENNLSTDCVLVSTGVLVVSAVVGLF